ncbi:ferredoxin:glutaredoxin reductase [Babesia caballi]|uniref:Ferredoxin:glutaredoxin reductase n=1 Tax=Babesia caballi TaxID=5871 RepID=A0AAV4LPP3_BABCB|nr:ferredoxin:glutaredoxin reductase [Babesia caballi]
MHHVVRREPVRQLAQLLAQQRVVDFVPRAPLVRRLQRQVQRVRRRRVDLHRQLLLRVLVDRVRVHPGRRRCVRHLRQLPRLAALLHHGGGDLRQQRPAPLRVRRRSFPLDAAGCLHDRRDPQCEVAHIRRVQARQAALHLAQDVAEARVHQRSAAFHRPSGQVLERLVQLVGLGQPAWRQKAVAVVRAAEHPPRQRALCPPRRRRPHQRKHFARAG